MPSKMTQIICLSFLAILLSNQSLANSIDLEQQIRSAWASEECETAFHLMENLKASGDAAVYHFLMGESFELGRCEGKSIDLAISSYERAFQVRETLGAMHIGALYLQEKRNADVAQKWFRTVAVLHAASEGSRKQTRDLMTDGLDYFLPRSLFENRTFPEEAFDEAIGWVKNLLKGPPVKIYQAALSFNAGNNGYPISKRAAEKLMSQADKAGYAPASWWLSQHLIERQNIDGEILPRQVLIHLKKAALGGIVEAQVATALHVFANYQDKYDLWSAYSWLIYAQKNGAKVDEPLGQIEGLIDPDRAGKIRHQIQTGAELPR